MKKIAANNYIWVSVDESTGSEQRFVANFMFGVLGVEKERGRSYLFSSVVMDGVNGSTMATFLDDSLKELSELIWSKPLIFLKKLNRDIFYRC